MSKMKVLIVEQKRGAEEIINGVPTGHYPGGMSQTVAYQVDGVRIQKKLSAGDVVEMDLPDARKHIIVGLCKKAPPNAEVTVSSSSSVGGLCGICHTKLESDEQIKSGYCDDECEDRAEKNREEDEARRNPAAVASAEHAVANQETKE